MRSKRVGTQSKFLRYIKCPLRALARARDLYMQSLAATGGVTYGNAMGCPTPHISSLPSSAFRSAHARAGGAAMTRSKTVAYGRIDEHKAFELGDDDKMGLLYHRSRSYAASTRLNFLP